MISLGFGGVKKVNKSIFLCCLFILSSPALANDNTLKSALKDKRFVDLVKKLNQKLSVTTVDKINQYPENLPPSMVDDVVVADGSFRAEGSFSAEGSIHDDDKREMSVPNSAAKAGIEAPETNITGMGEEEFVRIEEGEELFFSSTIGDIQLGNVFAIKNKKNAQIGLLNLVEMLDFPISVSLDSLSANGWFIRPENTFHLVFPNGIKSPAQVNVNGKEITVLPHQFTVESDDIYFDADEISRWFGINFEFNFIDMKVSLSSSQALPIQQHLARTNQQNKTTNQRSKTPVLPWKASPYQLLSSPLVDFQMSTTTTEDTTNYGYSLVGSHDLAFFNSRYYINGVTDNEIANARLTLGRESTNADLLGPLNATEYSFGDIIPVKVGSNGTGRLARGMKFSNQPKGRIIDYDQISLNGDIQPGWDIELYRNGVLLATQTSLSSGRYEFNDIDLLYGNNELELILYGPQGQVERRLEQVFVKNTGVKAGELIYAMSLTESNKTLFDVSTISNDTQSGWLLASEVSAGINDWMSVNIGQSYLLNQDDGEDIQGYSLGTNLSLFDRVLVQASAGIDNSDNVGYLFSARSQIGKQAIGLNYRQQSKQVINTDDILNTTNTSKQVNNQTTLTLAGPLYSSSGVNVSYQNQFYYADDGKGNSLEQISNTLGYSGSKMSFNHQLNWQNNNTSGVDEETLLGAVRFQKVFGPIFTRFSSNYQLKPEKEFTRHAVEFNWLVFPDIQTELELTYLPVTKNWRTQLDLTWRQDKFNFLSSFQTDKDDNWRVGLFLSFSFGIAPEAGGLHMSKMPLASNGALAVRVFEDLNVNGLYDDGETLIEGARIKGLQNSRIADTDENGVALLKAMPNLVTTDVILDQDSLDDPFLVPTTKGISVTPRAGFLKSVDFPVVQSGEVDGTIYIQDADGVQSVAAYATLYLRNQQGDLIALARSEYDGYYLFTDLLPGDYELSLDPEYLKRKRLRVPEGLSIVLSSAGDIMNALDFNLSSLEFTMGYVVTANSFDSLEMLKAYWFLIQRRYRKDFNGKVFYFFNEKDNKYDLNLGFYKLSEQAVDACEKLTIANVSCTTKPFEFGK